MRALPSLTVALAALLSAACASGGGGGEMESAAPADPNAPRICIDIDNRQGGGMAERIFLVGINSGQRLRIGDAPVGRVTSWCTQSAVVPGAHYILIERPSSDNIDPGRGQNQARAKRTTDFVLEAGDRWTYDVRRDRLQCTPGGAGDC